MTIAVAQRFGQSILLASDTRISDDNSVRHNIIPGRLKSVILSPKLSVAYAGHADPALAAIRECAATLATSGNNAAVEALAKQSARADVDIDFLCVCDGRILKVRGGQMYESADGHVIGDARVLTVLRQRADALDFHYSHFSFASPDKQPDARSVFLQAFMDTLADVTGAGFEGVGGLPVVLEATSAGSWYMGLGASRYVGPTRTTSDEGQDSAASTDSGATRFFSAVVPSRIPNFGVVGAIIPQAGLGWIYDPLRLDEPIPHPTPLLSGDDLGPSVETMTDVLDTYVRQHQ